MKRDAQMFGRANLKLTDFLDFVEVFQTIGGIEKPGRHGITFQKPGCPDDRQLAGRVPIELREHIDVSFFECLLDGG